LISRWAAEIRWRGKKGTGAARAEGDHGGVAIADVMELTGVAQIRATVLYYLI
jgi:hypothetical protein